MLLLCRQIVGGQKAKNSCKPINYKDVDDNLYVLTHYSKAMIRSPTWTPRPRTDLIL